MTGPADGPAVLPLHGWSYDIHAFVDVAPRLATAGYRVLVPQLRGFGTTRFLEEAAVRNGEQAALAVDAVAFLDSVGATTAVVAGFDWGASISAGLPAVAGSDGTVGTPRK
jgi:pimeloyl-ACP methyl ester carboxylesterase